MCERQHLISVIIPVYNTADYIERCLDSIINQSYKLLEIICINDGSTDSSLTILKQYSKRDSRIKVVSKKQGGVSSARNEGLRIASGDYIAFIDSDDWIHNKYFEYLIDAVEKDGDIAICRYKKVNDFSDDVVVNTSCIKTEITNIEEAVADDYVKSQIWGRIYKKAIIDQITFSTGINIGEDTEFNLKSMLKAKKIVLIESPLYYYFVRNNSLVHTTKHKEIMLLAPLYIEYAASVESPTQKKILLLEAFKVSLAGRYLSMFDVDKNKRKTECNKNMQLIRMELNKSCNLAFVKRCELCFMHKIPFLYRALRILTDKTMLNWEKEKRRNL